ncbi:MAG: V-type ATP synthase subunit A, partial [Paludibacteraceae bacterium]|nr:V-type ATP synthase subunit A [Paludibacteraceae bacterium]
YALEQARADRKRYPAVNPIDSYSKYVEYPEFAEYIAEKINPEWLDKVNDMKTYLLRSKEIQEQINILGDDGVPVDYHEEFWKGEVIDFVILQQDAFDKIDAVCPLERQQYMLELVMDICRHDYSFEIFTDVSEYFKRVINLCKQMNYSEFQSKEFKDYEKKLHELLAEKQI